VLFFVLDIHGETAWTKAANTEGAVHVLYSRFLDRAHEFTLSSTCGCYTSSLVQRHKTCVQ
jgi:hypothetical protein